MVVVMVVVVVVVVALVLKPATYSNCTETCKLQTAAKLCSNQHMKARCALYIPPALTFNNFPHTIF